MKKTDYESAVLINAALEDEQIASLIARIKEQITTNGGEIKEVEDWGRKRLAYMVKKNKIGYYAIFRFSAPTTIIKKLERFYVLEDNILRFLNIVLGKHALEYFANKKSRAESEAAESSESSSEDNEEQPEALQEKEEKDESNDK